MQQLIIFIIFIILFQWLSKAIHKQQEQQQEKEPPAGPQKDRRRSGVEELFESLGFSLPEEIPSAPKQEKVVMPQSEINRNVKKRKPEIRLEPPKVNPEKDKIPYRQEEEPASSGLPEFSRDKLEEGIILSEILGPPKAYRIRRGGGIGIRAGLKNR